MAGRIRIAMVAGEASGDLLASHLIAALKRHLPDADFFGIGGPKMMAEGFDAWWPAEKLSVHGYIEALKHYREIAGIRRSLVRRLRADPPDVFIGVDAPDFNLDLERKLKDRGIPAIHYVSPSIWAWRGGRIEKIARSVTKVLALFPFEPAIYEKRGIPVTYVGHPLADTIPTTIDRQEVRVRLALPADQPIFALLPGSRQGELEHLAEPFIETAKHILEGLPNALFLVPLATRETRLQFETALYRLEAQNLPFRLMFGHAQDAMAAADVVLVASGTATLEAALVKRPMAIAYRVSKNSYRILKRMGYLPYVGLPNILAGRFVVPEFIQDDATPENLSQALLNLYADRTLARRIEAHFGALHDRLKQNTAERAATAILACLRKPAEADGLARA